MCGLLKSGLKFYIKVVEDLKEEGFELKPYDGYVANKLVDGKYQTVCWHFDDLKLSYLDSIVNDKLIKKLKTKHETIKE